MSKFKSKIKELKHLVRASTEEIEIQVLHIRNELRKSPTKVDKDKIISHLVKIEEVLK